MIRRWRQPPLLDAATYERLLGELPEGPWFHLDRAGLEGAHFARVHAVRYRWILGQALQALPPAGGRVLDVGLFPGVVGFMLRRLRPGVRVDGVDLYVPDAAYRAFLDGVYGAVYEVELDPDNPRAGPAPAAPEEVPAAAYDVAVAGEVFEHLYDPRFFAGFSGRVLRPGGRLLLTTPNVAYIGHALRLLQGRTCYEDLETSHIYAEGGWRPHMRIYTAAEVDRVLAGAGLRPVRHDFLDNEEDRSSRLGAALRLKMALIRLAFVVPRYRNNLCLVYAREEGAA